MNTCQYCGKEYEPNSKQSRYCSDECRLEAKRKRAREYYYERTKGFSKDKIKEIEKKGVMKKCEVCGKEFRPPSSRTTCSPECQQIQRERYQHEYYLKKTKEKRKREREKKKKL